VSTDANIAVVAAVIAAIAAISSAVIAALFSLSNSRRTASQKLAEMRQLWIEDLRNHLADFVGKIHRILNECFAKGTQGDKEKSLKSLNADLMRLESYISLKLNHTETPHGRLVNVIKHARGAAAVISTHLDPKLAARIQLHLSEIDELARFIFKTEWNRASDEIKPVSREKRKERERKMREWYDKIPDTCTRYEHPVT